MRYFKKLLVAKVLAMAAVCGSLVADVQAALPGGGSRYDQHRVEANDADVFELVFSAEREAVVTVKGDGDTDLDLYVYDRHGNLIVCDEGLSDSCIVRFWPFRTGNFRIVVRNRGKVFNVYDIAAA